MLSPVLSFWDSPVRSHTDSSPSSHGQQRNLCHKLIDVSKQRLNGTQVTSQNTTECCVSHLLGKGLCLVLWLLCKHPAQPLTSISKRCALINNHVAISNQPGIKSAHIYKPLGNHNSSVDLILFYEIKAVFPNDKSHPTLAYGKQEWFVDQANSENQQNTRSQSFHQEASLLLSGELTPVDSGRGPLQCLTVSLPCKLQVEDIAWIHSRDHIRENIPAVGIWMEFQY